MWILGGSKKSRGRNIPVSVLDIGDRTRIEFDTVPMHYRFCKNRIRYVLFRYLIQCKLSLSVSMKKNTGYATGDGGQKTRSMR